MWVALKDALSSFPAIRYILALSPFFQYGVSFGYFPSNTYGYLLSYSIPENWSSAETALSFLLRSFDILIPGVLIKSSSSEHI